MCKTPSEWKQGFHTLAPPLPAKVCNSSRRGSYKEPVSFPGPAETPRKGNPKTAWVAELEVPPPHMRTAIYEWPRGTTRAYCACAFRLGTGRERGGSRCLTKKKMGLRRSLGPRFFVSYLRVLHGSLTRRLLLLLLQLPARNTARDTSHAHDLPARLTAAPRPPRSSLPRAPLQPISARGAHFALSQQGRSEREIAALATGLANQLARPTEGAERGHEGGESVERRGLATHQSKGASAPRAPPCPAPWWRRCGNQGKRRLPQGGGEGANS